MAYLLPMALAMSRSGLLSRAMSMSLPLLQTWSVLTSIAPLTIEGLQDKAAELVLALTHYCTRESRSSILPEQHDRAGLLGKSKLVSGA